MKIGILTFHWSDNYGAVLQCYALQEYLKGQGHDVEVINYAPLKYSLYYIKLLLHPSLLRNFIVIKNQKRKHKYLNQFKSRHLNLSKRFFKYLSISSIASEYDAIISGSDQVLNVSYLLYGENKLTPVYFLPFSTPKRIGYAVSFGCTSYPKEALDYASSLINNFDYIGVRENTGRDVLQQLGYMKCGIVVPDPTILYGNHLYDGLSLAPLAIKDYYCVYLLRSNITISGHGNVLYMDDTKQPVSMEEWISTIKYSKGLVTNSYHGMIMAILNHVPFAVILETGTMGGMNDRFYTLLERFGLQARIFERYTEAVIHSLSKPIDWKHVEDKITEYRTIGIEFLSSAL